MIFSTNVHSSTKKKYSIKVCCSKHEKILRKLFSLAKNWLMGEHPGHYRDTFSCMFHSQTLSIFWGKHRQRKLFSLIPHICQLKEGMLKLTLLLAACCSVSPILYRQDISFSD